MIESEFGGVQQGPNELLGSGWFVLRTVFEIFVDVGAFVVGWHSCEDTKIKFLGGDTWVLFLNDALGDIAARGSNPTIDRATIGGKKRLIGSRKKIALRLTGGGAVKRDECGDVAFQFVVSALFELDVAGARLLRIVLLLLVERLRFVECGDLGLPGAIVNASNTEDGPAQLFGRERFE